MSELSVALTQAAAAADWTAHHAAVLKVIGKRGGREEKAQQVSRARSSAVVAAVLETLERHGGDFLQGDLGALAAEVRGEDT